MSKFFGIGQSLAVKGLITTALLTFFSAGVAGGAEKNGSENLVLKEMTALDGAFKTTVNAIVLNQPERIAPAFEEANRARGDLERALKGGAVITLPRNQKRFREFLKLDDKFHRNLEILIKAARKNKMGVVRRQTHKLLDACVRCHSIFRK